MYCIYLNIVLLHCIITTIIYKIHLLSIRSSVVDSQIDPNSKKKYLLLEFTCSKLTIEILEQGVKYVQS